MRLFATLLMFVAFPALAESNDMHEGDFTATKTVSLPSYQTRTTCKEAGGTWKREACYFNTSDDVSVVRSESGYDVSVSTVGIDAKSCHFDSSGTLQENGTLLASVATIVGPCDVEIRYSGTDWVSVKSTGACNSLCENESLSLDILRAKRVDILGP